MYTDLISLSNNPSLKHNKTFLLEYDFATITLKIDVEKTIELKNTKK